VLPNDYQPERYQELLDEKLASILPGFCCDGCARTRDFFLATP
jgi:hypothetical protein